MKQILETERLVLREMNRDDAPFILELLNTPAYLRFIGDRGVRNVSDAARYLEDRPMASYREHGFGVWMVLLKDTQTIAGTCGLIRRPGLDHVDIGFALLPAFERQGIGYEAATATLRYGLETLRLPKIIGITDPENTASRNLLQRIGLHQESTVVLPDDDLELLVFSTSDATYDLLGIQRPEK